jgi:hypothetical protein
MLSAANSIGCNHLNYLMITILGALLAGARNHWWEFKRNTLTGNPPLEKRSLAFQRFRGNGLESFKCNVTYN